MSLLGDLYKELNRLFPRDVVVDDRKSISIGQKKYEAVRKKRHWFAAERSQSSTVIEFKFISCSGRMQYRFIPHA